MRRVADTALSFDDNTLRRGPLGPRRRVVALSLMALLALGLGACKFPGGGDASAPDSTAVAAAASDSVDTQDDNDEDAKGSGKTSSVTVAETIRGDLVLPILAEGTVRARSQTEIRPEVAGTVASVAVKEGDRVKRGQLLVRLDPRDYKVAYEESRSAYLRALGTLSVEEGDSALADGAKLPALGDDLDSQVDAIRSGAYRGEIAAARTGVSAAAAAMHRAQLNLERCELRAPFAGVVSGLTLAAGEWVTAGQTLCTLTDNLRLEAEVNVLESDLGAIEEGRPALLAFPALAETLQVKVDVVSPLLETDSRSCPALLRLENTSGRVRPGMFTRAAIAGRIVPDRLLVPREAVLTRDGRPLVFKVADGLTQWLYVELGERNEQFVEIKRVLQGGSLEPGDPVVVSDHLTLTHGAKVKIKRTLHPKSPWKLDAADGTP